jgi:hypothetical protein
LGNFPLKNALIFFQRTFLEEKLPTKNMPLPKHQRALKLARGTRNTFQKLEKIP